MLVMQSSELFSPPPGQTLQNQVVRKSCDEMLNTTALCSPRPGWMGL